MRGLEAEEGKRSWERLGLEQSQPPGRAAGHSADGGCREKHRVSVGASGKEMGGEGLWSQESQNGMGCVQGLGKGWLGGRGDRSSTA